MTKAITFWTGTSCGPMAWCKMVVHLPSSRDPKVWDAVLGFFWHVRSQSTSYGAIWLKSFLDVCLVSSTAKKEKKLFILRVLSPPRPYLVLTQYNSNNIDKTFTFSQLVKLAEKGYNHLDRQSTAHKQTPKEEVWKQKYFVESLAPPSSPRFLHSGINRPAPSAIPVTGVTRCDGRADLIFD